MPINYELARREGPKLKAMLTRALNQKDGLKKRNAIVAACVAAVKHWEVWGAWPDNWSMWQRALTDATWNDGDGRQTRLENLV